MPFCRAVVGVLAVLAVQFACAVAPASAAPIAPEYVALGDSYAAGLGAGAYDPASGSCKRSATAHPQLWARAHGIPSFRFAACTGASTMDVVADQVGQLSLETGLVTITVGGTDAGFSDVLVTCTLGGDQQCADRAATAVSFVRTELPGRFDRTYAAIRARAPQAKVVVLGYPRLFSFTPCLLGLSQAKRKVLNDGANVLAEVTSDRARAAGFTFVDVRDAFAGHGVCAPNPWLHGLSVPVNESYHPTASGQVDGYLPLLTAAAWP
ncbi:SGNH/GDSL hydrolase family protein [Solihabitans fulvus]|uniref:SGNH/GDSL hydrolase family protein n=1 Tax=Solihabitans fulvus TaxID=1892852 RepID=A0A5B2XC11_9PSEU|nr:SGNH/GDSL hydrolase family protein [Solihabitans fulvus]KAA2261157.1 SGNH/GDSL hydrolase family protein [Solihabitans fulvus]